MPNPWAVRSVYRDEEQDQNPWAVRAVHFDGEPQLTAAKRTPWERFTDNFEAGRQTSILGATADALNAGILGQSQKDAQRDEAQTYAMRSQADPWYQAPGGVLGKLKAGASTLGGQLAGGIGSPESWVGLGEGSVGKMALKNFLFGAATDVPIQGLQNKAGTEDGFDPWRPVEAGAMNALIPLGLEGTGRLARGAVKAAKDVGQVAGRAVDNLTARGPIRSRMDDWTPVDVFPAHDMAGDASPSPRVSVADMWDGLVRQESGGSQAATSPKGARGVAQLMPDTARQVAAQLGEPHLADLAMQNTPEGRAANERLGQVYLQQQLDEFGDPAVAAAAYNAGPGRAREWVKKFGDPREIGYEAWIKQIPFAETRDYVQRVAGRLEGRAGPAGEVGGFDRANFTPEEVKPDAIPFGEQPRRVESVADAFKRLEDEVATGKAGEQQLPASRAPDIVQHLNEAGWSYEPQRQVWQSPEGHVVSIAQDGPHDVAVRHAPAAGTQVEQVAAPPKTAREWQVQSVEPVQPRVMEAPKAPDLTDHALDVLRGDRKIPNDQGDTLLDFVSKRGGIADDGGELSGMDAQAWHRSRPFRSRLANPEGRTLGDMAVAAQEAGYLPERFGQEDTRASPQDLLDAMRQELSGRPVYSRASDHSELRQHVEDLQQVIHLAGLDPARMSNPELRRGIDNYLLGRSDPGPQDFAPKPYEPTPFEAMGDIPFGARLGAKVTPEAMSRNVTRDAPSLPFERVDLANGPADQGLIPGVEPVSPAQRAISDEMRRRLQQRGFAPPPAGGLFDEAAKAQPDLFASGAKLGMKAGPWEPVSRTPEMPRQGAQGGAGTMPPAEPWRTAGEASAPPVAAPGPMQQAGASAASLGSRNIGGLRNAPRPGAIPAGQGADYAGATVSRLAQQLRMSLGITHRQGRMTLKGGAVGEFDPRTSVIRTKAVQEMDVLAHEATHALEAKAGPALQAAFKTHAKELRSLAYPGANPAHTREEGFAEFGRWYVTNPEHAKRIAPNFYEAFEQALAHDRPEVLRDIKDIQAAYDNMLKSASVDVASASVAYTGKPGPLDRLTRAMDERGLGGVVSDLADKAYSWFIDDLNPLHRAVAELQDIYAANHGGKRLDLKAAENPYALARLAREAYAAGHMDLMEGVVPYHGSDPSGPSLSQALEHALGERALGKWSKADLSRLDAYLIARRMVHEWDRYDRGEMQRPPDKNTREFHEQVIADSEAANPTWRDAAQLIYDWNTALWKKRLDAGLITKAAHDHGLNAHPDYVPLMRDVSDKRSNGGPNRPRGGLQFAGGVKAFEGSTRDIISPLSSMMREAYELNALIRRNDIVRTLDDLAQKAGPGSGAIAERLPPHEIEAVNVNAIEALTKAAHEAGLSERDITSLAQTAEVALGDQTQATIFRHREMTPRKGEAVVFAWRDGKKQPLLLADGEFGQDMFTAISGMNREMSNFLVDTMSAATQLLRHGVTLSPEFMSRNILRDQLATWINTDVGYVPGYHFVKGAIEQARGGPIAQRYKIAGGMRGGSASAALKKPFPHDDVEALAQLQHLRKKGYLLRAYNPLTNPLRSLAALTDLSESGSRLGVMGLAFKQAKRRGLSDYEAMVEAAYQSRDYLDFGRHGAKSLTAIRIVSFLNASLQSLDKAARVMTASGDARPSMSNLKRVLMPLAGNAPRTPAEKRALAHAYKAWAKVAALGALGGALRVLYANDPEYQEIGDQLRASHWFFKANGTWVRIPKPFELAELSNIIERTYEATALKDPKAPERMWSDFAQVVAPPFEVTALTVPYQIARNRDHNGRPIVPDYLRGTVDPEMQFNSYTSDLGKFIGHYLHVSPAVVDHVITGYGGSLGRYVLQGTDMAAERVTGRPRTAIGPQDAFLARGFVTDPARGSTSQKEFWDQVSKTGGHLTEAEGTFRAYMKAGDDAKAAAYINHLDPSARAYVMAKVFTKGGTSGLHPMVRAQAAVSVLGDLRQEVRDATLTSFNGQPIHMTPAQRREADTALSHMAMVEMRNALILAGDKGWAQKQTMTRKDSMADLGAINPALPLIVRQRMLEQKVLPAGVVANGWANLRPKLEAPADPERLGQVMDTKRLRSGDHTAKRKEVIRQLQRRGMLPATEGAAFQ